MSTEDNSHGSEMGPHSGVVDRPSDGVTIWRYMDFTKYVSLIANEALFFAKASVLDDAFEGSYSKPTAEYRRETLAKELPSEESPYTSDEFARGMAEFSKALRDFIYISSWHENDRESAAMWELYLKSGEGVAVRSTVGKLAESLTELEYPRMVIGRVRYIDFEMEGMPHGDVKWPYFFKRKSFEHEREVRAVVSDTGRMMKAMQEGGLESVVDGEGTTEHGRYAPVRVEDLIDAVHVAPSAPDWLETLVQKVNESFGVGVEVKHTDLDKEPVF